MTDNTPEFLKALELVKAHPNFKVTTRLPERTVFREGEPLDPGILLVTDTETTGTVHGTDKIIEYGGIRVLFDQLDGTLYRVLDTYEALEDPGMPIPAEATKVNGITDDMVVGKRIDDRRLAEMTKDVDIVIAHHSKFDRPMLEARSPLFESLSWGCSLSQVPWKEEGIGTAKLDYVAFALGYFFEAHRALPDCFALLECLQLPLPVSGKTAFQHIFESYESVDLDLAAIKSPYDEKDKLSLRGYKFDSTDPSNKYWHTHVKPADLDAELEWLRDNVYASLRGRAKVQSWQEAPKNRFSLRKGPSELHQM